MLNLFAEAQKIDWPDVVGFGILVLGFLVFVYLVLKSDV